jgi:hypothetical protein
MKMAGCNTEEEFYQKYPSEKAFFAAHPHMKGNQTMKNGGAASGHAGSYWNGDTWVSNEGGSGTYSNGVYYGNGGATFPIGGSAPIFGMGGSASFNISNNDYPSPFAMAPGTGMGSGYLQDLPTHMAHGGHIPGADIIDPFAMYPGTGSGGGMLQDLPTEMKKGGIHIDPSKRGTFTAAATKHGKGVQEFASQVLANKENYSPAMVKKANFARNASKWQHEYGGMYQDGGYYQQGGYKTKQKSPIDSMNSLFVNMRDYNLYSTPDENLAKRSGYPYKKVGDGFHVEVPKSQEEIKNFGRSKYETIPKYETLPGLPKNGNMEIEQFAYGGHSTMMQDGGATMPDNPGFRALPSAVQQKIMSNMQTGGMVTDDRMIYGPGGQYMQTGGMINPYHPMAKFMRGGYYQGGGNTSTPVGQYVPGLGYWNGSSFQDTDPKTSTTTTTTTTENQNDPNWHPPMSAPNNTTNTTNNTNNFNLQFFLNEQCKDALNIMDFINQLQLNTSDLDMVGRVGYAEGISKIFIRGLKELDIFKRPLHCSDLKREVVYVKDKDAWEKDGEDKKTMKNAIKFIAAKNFNMLNEWIEDNPEYNDYDSKKHKEYHNIILKASGGATPEEDEKNYNKIIRNVAQEITIDKSSDR